jgi:hypothetical protein
MCSYDNLIYTETSTDNHLEMSDLKASDEWTRASKPIKRANIPAPHWAQGPI